MRARNLTLLHQHRSTTRVNPFMQNRRLFLRQCCRSSNAYEPSVALRATFLACLAPLHEPHDNSSTHSQWRRFSTTQHAEKEEEAVYHGKIGAGNLFASYDALVRGHEKKPEEHTVDTNDVRGDDVRSSTIIRPVRAHHRQPREKAQAIHPASRGRQISHRPLTANAEDEGGTELVRGPGAIPTWKDEMIAIANKALKDPTGPVIRQPGAPTVILDYKPLSLDVPPPPPGPRIPFPWAVQPAARAALTGRSLLDQEMLRFAKHGQLSPAERAARQSVITEVIDLVKQTLPENVAIAIQGSEETGLATPTSDIDFRVYWQTEQNGAHGISSRRNLSSRLDHLHQQLKQDARFEEVLFRPAKYSIVTAVHKETGIDVQLIAAPSTSPQQAATIKYLAEIPNLRTTYTLLRTALGLRGLVEVYHGGIGAYGLFMMLVAAIKRKSSDPPRTAADQFLRFLEMYGRLDCARFGVSVEPAKLFKKHTTKDMYTKELLRNTAAAERRGDLVRAGQWAICRTRGSQPYLFCLQDASKPTNDLGFRTNAIKHIQQTLRTMHHNIKQDMRNFETSIAKGHEWQESILSRQVGWCHEIYLARRRRVERYGLRILMQKLVEEEKRRIAGQQQTGNDNAEQVAAQAGL